METTLPRHRQRTQDLCAALTDMARALGPDAKMPTVLELCQEFKTSSTTLNHALTELERRSVLYRVRAVGIFVSPSLRPNVALVVDPKVFRGVLHSPFWDLLARSAEERAMAKGENFSFHFALPNGSVNGSAPIHVGLAHSIENRQVDGLIAINLNRTTIQWLEAHDIPLVGFAAPCLYHVEHDDDEMIRMGVKALHERGCRRIEMWNPAEPQPRDEGYVTHDLQWFVDRVSHAFSKALEEVGLDFEPGQIRDNRVLLRSQKSSSLPSEREQGYEMARAVFSCDAHAASTRPDGIVIINDLMSAGALKAMEKLGVEVGRDVQIATLSNAGSPVLADYEDRVIRMEFEAQEVTSQLFAMLETLMRGDSVADPCVMIAPHLRMPESSTAMEDESN